MASNTPSRYIVRAREVAPGDATRGQSVLSEFIRSIGNDPAIALVDQIGPVGNPHTLVISVSADLAGALEERFRQTPQLMLERDRPLSLY